MLKNKFKSLSISLAVAVLIAASGSAALAATLNAYSIMPEKYCSKVFKAFTDETGIKVNFIRFSSGEALARIVAEKKNPQVDVLWGGPAATYTAGMKEGVFAPYKPVDAESIPAQFKDPDGYWTGIGVIPLVFLTNTKFLEKNSIEAPASWNDLLNPVYANNLQMADARTSGTAAERIYSLVKVYGEDGAFDYQKKMHKNIQLYTKSGAGGAMPVAQGQAASGIFYIVDALEIQQQGYPVVISYPVEGVTYGVESTGMLSGCKQPELAKKFLDWATSKKLAEVLVKNHINYIPTCTSVKIDNPALDVSKVTLLEAPTQWKGEKRKGYVKRWVNEVIR